MSALPSYDEQKPKIRRGSSGIRGTVGFLPNSALLATALNALGQSVAIIDAKGFIVGVNDTWRRYADENGMRWQRYGLGYNYLSVLDAAAERDEMSAQIALGIRRVLSGSAGSFRIEYACETLAGCHFLLQVTAFNFGDVRHAVVAHENISLMKMSEGDLRAAKEAAESRCREEQTRRATAEHRRRIAEAIAEMQTIANSGLQLEDALQGIVERVSQTAGSTAAAIYSAEERWDRPVLMAGSLNLGNPMRRGRSPIPSSVLSQAISDRRGAHVSDIRQCKDASSPGDPAHAARYDHRALLLTAIQHKEGLFGYLVLFYKEPRQFGDDELELAGLFGRQVELALENAELRSQAEKAAVENERSRLARELHDAVTQTLFSSSVVAEALPRVWERDPAEGRRALEELRVWTRGALAEMRTLLLELRPAVLSEKPLPDLMRQLSEATGARLSIPVICQLSSEAEPPTNVKLCLYRIAQEALNNIAKHASPSTVEIRYLATADTVALAVIDNGRGFDPERSVPGRMGLGIMRERASQVGAKLTIRSAPGEGTQVQVDWRSRGRKRFHEQP